MDRAKGNCLHIAALLDGHWSTPVCPAQAAAGATFEQDSAGRLEHLILITRPRSYSLRQGSARPCRSARRPVGPSARRPVGHADAQIAALALLHRATLVTRNVTNFTGIDELGVHNPWMSASKASRPSDHDPSGCVPRRASHRKTGAYRCLGAEPPATWTRQHENPRCIRSTMPPPSSSSICHVDAGADSTVADGLSEPGTVSSAKIRRFVLRYRWHRHALGRAQPSFPFLE